MKSFLKLLLLVFSGIYLSACEKDKINHTPHNQQPVAEAGNDTSLFLPVNSTVLDGSGSYDLDGHIVTYNWSKIGGPQGFAISNTNAVQTEVSSLEMGLYQFELMVSDDGFRTDRDTIVIAVDLEPCEFRLFRNARLNPIAKLSQARSNMMVASVNGKILFAGGNTRQGLSSARVDIYDINSDTWITGELSKDWFGDRYGVAVASAGNKIFFAGGGEFIGGEGSSLVDIYDASLNSWSKAELSQGRMELIAVPLNNKVFFAGGGYVETFAPFNWVASRLVDIYDINTNTWTTSNLSEGRWRLVGAAAEDKIYFAGGIGSETSDKIDIYDSKTNSWSTARLKMPRSDFSGIVADNKIFWAGGVNGSGWVNNVEIFDLNTEVSTLTCFEPRLGPMSVLKGDFVIFFTSSSWSDLLPDNQFDIFHIPTGVWSIGLLNQRLSEASIISVNNTIYVAGGILNDALTDQVWKLEF